VDVNEGLFQVSLGENISLPTDLFTGSDRWIGINVAGDGEMTPRTKISSVPYAKTDGDWALSGNDIHTDVSGNVGIGTSTPAAKLEIAGEDSCFAWSGDHSYVDNQTGYIRLGNLQICWGVYHTANSGGTPTTHLPDSFLNDEYQITLTPAQINLAQPRWGCLLEKNQSNFKGQTYGPDGGRSANVGSYIAIGRWK